MLIISPLRFSPKKSVENRIKGGTVLQAFNLLGEEIFREPINREPSTERYELTINVSTWQNGIYLITLGEQKAKIIVSH